MRPKLEVAPYSKNRLTYDEAVMYCFFLEFNGKRGWRIPTVAEYCTYYDRLHDSWHDGISTFGGTAFVKPVRDKPL